MPTLDAQRTRAEDGAPGLFGSADICKMLRFLYSRWSVEMTGLRRRTNNAQLSLLLAIPLIYEHYEH